MTTPNIELLDRTLEHIKAAPIGWDQGTWRKVLTDPDGIAMLGPTECGTAMCFAGEAVHLGDPQAYVIQPKHIAQARDEKSREKTEDCRRFADVVYSSVHGYETVIPEWINPTGRGKTIGVSQVAPHLLGIDSEQANVLFNEINTLPALEALVEAIKAGEDSEIVLEGIRDEAMDFDAEED